MSQNIQQHQSQSGSPNLFEVEFTPVRQAFLLTNGLSAAVLWLNEAASGEAGPFLHKPTIVTLAGIAFLGTAWANFRAETSHGNITQ